MSIRVYAFDRIGDLKSFINLHRAFTPRASWDKIAQVNPDCRLVAYELADEAGKLRNAPPTEAMRVARCLTCLRAGQTFDAIASEWEQVVLRWARDRSLDVPADTCETVVAATPGPRRPPRTVIVQEWIEGLDDAGKARVRDAAWAATLAMAKGA